MTFGNDFWEVAGLFCDALDHAFRGVFERIVSAITDWSDDKRFIGPFLGVFFQRMIGRIGHPG